ncbi:MAG: zf-TFIIB domain-containing protein [Bacteroidota bacterium]
MQCPVCDEKLREVERQGVAIDICPGCKGIWLDRGELEKLIEMSRNDGAALRQAPEPSRREEPSVRLPEREYRSDDDGHRGHDDHRDRDEHYRDDRERQHGSSGNRRRGSWLTDILEGIGGGD